MDDILDVNIEPIKKSMGEKISFFTFIIALILILLKFISYIQLFSNIDSVLIPVYSTMSLLFDTMILGSIQVFLLIISFITFYGKRFQSSMIINLIIILLNYIFPYIYNVS